jgi:adenylylsulfate kinase-like enzyme
VTIPKLAENAACLRYPAAMYPCHQPTRRSAIPRLREMLVAHRVPVVKLIHDRTSRFPARDKAHSRDTEATVWSGNGGWRSRGVMPEEDRRECIRVDRGQLVSVRRSTGSVIGRTVADERGVCVWFTGLSGSGKSTITKALTPKLEASDRTVTVLDTVPSFRKLWCERTSERKLLSKGVVAREVVRHGGVVICVTVSARRDTRETVRSMIGPESFIEVFVDTSADVSAARKRERRKKRSPVKRARAAVRSGLAHIPFREAGGYERPRSPDLTIDTTSISADESAAAIFGLLVERRFVMSPSTGAERRADASSDLPETKDLGRA